MVPSFVLTYTLDLMVVPKALASSPSNLPMTLVTPSNNSMATIGKAARLRYVKIASLALDLDSEAEVASALVEVLAEDSAAAEDIVVVVGSTLDSQLVAEDSQAALVEVVMTEEPALFLLLPIHSPIMPLLVQREARLSTFAMYVFPIRDALDHSTNWCHSFPGPQATKILSSSSPPSERLSKPKFSTSQTADLEALVLFASILLKMRRPLSRNSPVTSTVVAHLV
jgi:hypothetical protein